LTPKPKGVVNLPRQKHLQSLRTNSPWVVQLLIRNRFYPHKQGDLDWPLTPKTIGVIYWPRLMHLCSLRFQGPMGCQVIDRKRFSHTRSIWPWPLTPWPEIDRDHLLAKTNQCTYKVWGPTAHGLSSYWSEAVFTYNVNMTLTFDHKIIMRHLFAKTIVLKAFSSH
jgi:hypothetical protein